jgi:hypothetical protein
MRALVLVSAVLLLAPRLVGAQTEIVTGFHGYAWGTPISEIPELAGRPPAGVKDDLVIYSLEVTVAGRRALAGFYAHPRSGQLLEGAYVFALQLSECPSVWAAVVREIEAAYPTLVEEARIPVRSTSEQRRVYETDCEYYVYNSHLETWSASYLNPSPPGDRILLSMRTVERSPRLSVVYRGGAGQAWATRTPPPPAGSIR